MRATLIPFLFLTLTTGADTLHDLVKSNLPASQTSFSEDRPDSFGIEPYIPISTFQFQEGEKWKIRDRGLPKQKTEDGDFFAYRAYFKSFEELRYSAESRRVSADLMQIDRLETVNERRYEVYAAIVNNVLGGRLNEVFEKRRLQLQTSVEKYGARMGLSKISTRDILGDFRDLQKIEAEQAEIKSLAEPSAVLHGATNGDLKSVQSLLASVSAVQKQLAGLSPEADSVTEKRDDLAIRLDRINREIQWGDQTKIIDRVEYQHAQIDQENTVTVTFNVPFLRFDRENRSRERALLQVKEKEVARRKQATRAQLTQQLQLLNGLAARLAAIQTRLGTLSGLNGKLKSVPDLELKSELSAFNFEMEQEALKLGREYYTRYLQYLRDLGALARNVDYLNAKWEEI